MPVVTGRDIVVTWRVCYFCVDCQYLQFEDVEIGPEYPRIDCPKCGEPMRAEPDQGRR
jgi:DNA polymerase III alpha subunit (gram-positive type)